MTGINQIKCTLSTILETICEKQKANKLTDLEKKIFSIANKILEAAQDGCSGCSINGVEIPSSDVSTMLTLADLKATMEYSDDLSKQIIDLLELQPVFKQISSCFPIEERIKAVSDSVLRHIPLYELQVLNCSIKLIDTSVWYALAPDDQLFKRKVCELEKLSGLSRVLPARIADLITTKPELIDKYRHKQPKELSLSSMMKIRLGEFCTLSGSALNARAKNLSDNACRIFSDEQIRSLDFNQFSGSQLDAVIEGDSSQLDVMMEVSGSIQKIQHRLGLLSLDQVKVFLDKSSGTHFDKFSTTFYEKLPLGQYNQEQFNKLFNASYGEKLNMCYHLQLVSPLEILKGLHLLSETHLCMLSTLQIASLDYANMTHDQLKAVFLSDQIPLSEKLRRIHSIPVSAVNHVLKKINEIFSYLLPEQKQVADLELLDQIFICKLFPGFSFEHLLPGYQHKREIKNTTTYHYFTMVSEGVLSNRSYGQKQVDTIINNIKTTCQKSALLFTPGQLKKIEHLMYPEVRDFLDYVQKRKVIND